MEEKTIKLTEEERTELVKLYEEAENTPVLVFGETDISASAWEAVKNKMDELGMKYGFNPKTIAINKNTGEIKER